MLALLTRDVVRALDASASTTLGLPSIVLMENAGRGACDYLRTRYANALAQVVVLGGVGQNGGDAWVLARQLIAAAHTPRCLLIGERAKVRGDALINLNALERMGVSVVQIEGDDLTLLDEALRSASLVVDGLFGTGLDRPVTGMYAAAIERINACIAPRLALDIPSGVDADSGGVLGVAVQADSTVTFAAHKRGLHQHPGARLAGELHCVSIGVPAPKQSPFALIEASDVASWLPRRAADTHKGRGGHVLVVAGAPGRTGAAMLAGFGAMRAGAGLVTLSPRAGARAALDAKVFELMTADLPDGTDPAVSAVRELMRDKHAALIGPGLGLDAEARAIVHALAVELDKPCVLDADALTACVGRLGSLRNAAAARVLTPHPGEAARLLETSTDRLQADRYGAAARLADESGSVVALKGARSIVATPAGRMYVCPLDVPALAVAGTGDVLGGIIAALLTQLEPEFAAAAGVYLHARAGQLAAQSDRGLFAREVADAVPRALEDVRRHPR
jgi:hydroxyethylthiazole kinase-like uncharacterized protein yjeF